MQLEIEWYDLFSARRSANIRRFANEIYPFPLRDKPFRFDELWRWTKDILVDRGIAATFATFAISVVAIVLSGVSASVFILPAARNLATSNPFISGRNPNSIFQIWKWKIVVLFVRSWFVLARVVPEYIWAFLLIGILGPGAWPAILALAIHNFGILGRLGAEVVENVDPKTPIALRSIGLTRFQIFFSAIVPTSFSKWLLFFFYRWETCIREASVLGMLGISSLGFWVRDSRARDRYDEMFLLILLSSMLVLLVDLISAVTRYFVRNA